MTLPPAPAPAPAVAVAPRTPQGPERAALLDAVRPHVERRLGKPVRFLVRTLRVEGRWAYLDATMQDPLGGRFSYEGTPHAEDAAHGTISDRYAALLSHSEAGWSVVADAVGPTDAPQAGWAAEYGAPQALVAR